MAISAKTRNRLDELIAALKKADGLTLNERDDLIEIITEAAEGTNGLTVEAKTQANSVNIFNLCYLYIRDRLEAPKKVTSWKDVLIRCSWQTVAVVAITVPAVAVLLIYQPQLAAILEHFIK